MVLNPVYRGELFNWLDKMNFRYSQDVLMLFTWSKKRIAVIDFQLLDL